ncbi:MAG: GAF domain-containing protein [Ignavibacteria bacterium]|jgi:diguanylate cyclase (GGDEF)-like protein
MDKSNKLRKRILIFIVVPILNSIPFFTDDLILEIIAVSLSVIYVGFIIFLRDSSKQVEDIDGSDYTGDEIESEEETASPKTKDYDTDLGEDFKIVSPNKNIEVITSDNYRSVSDKIGQKNFFKPPDLKQNFVKIATEKIPEDVSEDEEFAFVLEKILTVAKEVYLAHSSLFFWYNKNKQKLTLEKYVSSSTDLSNKKFDLEDDVLSKVIEKEEPELLTDVTLNAERDVIRYYSRPQGIKSFIGVPLYYGNMLAGVLALDSKEGDAFGIETIYSLGRFVRVISLIISLFDKKFEESVAEKRLQALLNSLSMERKFIDNEDLYKTIEESVKDLIQWDAFTFVYYDSKSNSFNTAKIINKTSLKYIGEHLDIELKGTIVGKAIISGTPVKIDDTSEEDYKRFSNSEDVNFEGSFLAVPLVYDEQNYGVFCFESLKKNNYTNADVGFIRNAVKIFSFIVYTYSNQKLLRSLLSVDVETRVLNYETFLSRLDSELEKSFELSLPGSIALICIDDFLEQENLFENDPFPKVLKSIVDAIKEEIDASQILFGRFNERIFGLYFFNTNSKDVFLWAEKLRIKIARKPIAVLTKQTTFTISVGVASTNKKTDVDEVIRDAKLALNKAIEKGGNTVKSVS